MKKHCCTARCTLSTIGIILIAFGASFAIFWPQTFQYLMQKELQLTPDSRSFQEWKKPSVPLYMDFYFFNWTNPQDLSDHSTKPIMEELGPYRFREKPQKVNITFNDNSTVSYKTMSTFFFDVEGSNGTLDDIITTINVVSVGAAAKARNWPYLQQKTVSMGLTVYQQEIHVTKQARELLFDGYEDNMVLMAKENPMFDTGEIPFDRIGFFYKRNATAELSGYFNAHTGVDDIQKLGTIQEWNFSGKNKLYEGNCSKLYGSTGEFFPPGQTKDKPIALFTPDMCRSIPFDYEKDVDVHGVMGHRYTGGARAVDNGTLFPENECFCGEDCMPSGVMNTSACNYESPLFMSFPHYYAGDPFYLNEVEGLMPNKEKHQPFFTIEPITGAPLEVTARFQVNFLIRNNEDIALFQEAPRVIIPVMWFEQKFAMDKKMADEIKAALSIPHIGQMMGIVFIVLGVFLVLLYPVINLIKPSRKVQANGHIRREADDIDKKEKEASPLINRTTITQITPPTQQAKSKY
ncbi:unnamed protein product [Diamesa serratosioi]